MDQGVAVLTSAVEASQPEFAVLEAASAPSNAVTAITAAPALKVFAAVEIVAVFLCFAAEIFAKLVLHLAGPYIYPLKTQSQTAWDFVLFTNKFQHFGRWDFFQTDADIPFAYPAPLAVAYKVFFSYHAHPLRLFVGFTLAVFAIAGVFVCRALHRQGVSWLKASAFVSTAYLLAYPLWYELKQGNIEICVWVLVALGVWAFCKNKPAAAAVCFGIAGSMKIFPFVFLGLLLAARRYREMALAAVAAMTSTIVSLWLVGPGILNTWRSVKESLAIFRMIYVLHLRSEEIGFDHSLFGVYKRFYHPLPTPVPLGHIADIYLAVAAVFGIALYFVKIRHLPLINQVLCLVVASILLPPISFDYTLMYLYIPWAMLVIFAQEQWRQGTQTPQKVAGLTTVFVCLAVLMSPQSEFIWHAAHFGGQIKALVLIALLGVGLKYPFKPEARSFQLLANNQT
jgi:hypothetical protein